MSFCRKTKKNMSSLSKFEIHASIHPFQIHSHLISIYIQFVMTFFFLFNIPYLGGRERRSSTVASLNGLNLDLLPHPLEPAIEIPSNSDTHTRPIALYTHIAILFDLFLTCVAIIKSIRRHSTFFDRDYNSGMKI